MELGYAHEDGREHHGRPMDSVHNLDRYDGVAGFELGVAGKGHQEEEDTHASEE